MLVIPGSVGKDTCDGVTRRELLRVGGSAVMGISLANLLGLAASAAPAPDRRGRVPPRVSRSVSDTFQ